MGVSWVIWVMSVNVRVMVVMVRIMVRVIVRVIVRVMVIFIVRVMVIVMVIFMVIVMVEGHFLHCRGTISWDKKLNIRRQLFFKYTFTYFSLLKF